MPDNYQGAAAGPPPHLPDPPPWSPRRWRMVKALFCAGLGLAILGACPLVSDARGVLLIDQGATMAIAAALFAVGGASGERAAAWLSARRLGGPP